MAIRYDGYGCVVSGHLPALLLYDQGTRQDSVKCVRGKRLQEPDEEQALVDNHRSRLVLQLVLYN